MTQGLASLTLFSACVLLGAPKPVSRREHGGDYPSGVLPGCHHSAWTSKEKCHQHHMAHARTPLNCFALVNPGVMLNHIPQFLGFKR